MGVKCKYYKLHVCSFESKVVHFLQFWGMKHFLGPVCGIWPKQATMPVCDQLFRTMLLVNGPIHASDKLHVGGSSGRIYTSCNPVWDWVTIYIGTSSSLACSLASEFNNQKFTKTLDMINFLMPCLISVILSIFVSSVFLQTLVYGLLQKYL